MQEPDDANTIMTVSFIIDDNLELKWVSKVSHTTLLRISEMDRVPCINAERYVAASKHRVLSKSSHRRHHPHTSQVVSQKWSRV